MALKLPIADRLAAVVCFAVDRKSAVIGAGGVKVGQAGAVTRVDEAVAVVAFQFAGPVGRAEEVGELLAGVAVRVPAARMGVEV